MSNIWDTIYIVVLQHDEIQELNDRVSGKFSYSINRRRQSAGRGRTALILTPFDDDNHIITHIGIVQNSSQSTSIDQINVLYNCKKIPENIPADTLLKKLGKYATTVSETINQGRGGPLSDAISKRVFNALKPQIDKSYWPNESGSPSWMTDSKETDNAANFANALGTAFSISDMDPERIRPLVENINSPLQDILPSATEPSLIDNDLRNFPSLEGTPVDYHIYRFTDGESILDIMNVNATSIESATGVDLIYYNANYEAYTLVQYKRMEKSGGSRISTIDARLPGQLNKMEAIDNLSKDSEKTPTTYRLGKMSTFTKFAYFKKEPVSASDLTRGIYLPSEYIQRLYKEGELKGPKGGETVTFENIHRWISNDLFATLVRNGWVGSQEITHADITQFVREKTRIGHTSVIAAHRSS